MCCLMPSRMMMIAISLFQHGELATAANNLATATVDAEEGNWLLIPAIVKHSSIISFLSSIERLHRSRSVILKALAESVPVDALANSGHLVTVQASPMNERTITALDQRREATLLAVCPPDQIMAGPPAVISTCRRVGPVPENLMCADLYKAATSGDLTRLDQLLNPSSNTVRCGVHSRCQLSEVTAEWNTVLHLAAGTGNLDLVEEVYTTEKSQLTAENSWGDTPLHCAARARSCRVLLLLLQLADQDNGAVNLNEVLRKQNRAGETALHEAVRNGHDDAVLELVDKTPELASMENVDGVSPLYLAVMNGSITIVERLIACDNASFAGPKGQTALHAAVLCNPDIASKLLERKPTMVDATDDSGSTPLHYAASGLDSEIVKELLKISPSAAYFRDTDGFSPIHVAVRAGKFNAIRLILKACPGSVELVDFKGRNFLHTAVENNNMRVVQSVLFSRRVNVFVHWKKVNKMLEALVNQLDFENNEVLRALINKLDIKDNEDLGALINKQDFEGNTPLHLAVESANSMMVSMLAHDRRVRKDIMNKQGKTPLDLASKITRFLPLALVLLELAGAPFSVRRHDRVEPWNRVDSEWYDKISKELAIVSGLITTVSFSATFNLPGGYDSSNGKVALHGQGIFNLFLACDSVAMISSLFSVLLFIFARAVDDRSRQIFVAGVFTFWQSIFFMLMAFMTAAFSTGVGRGILFIACIAVVAPLMLIALVDYTLIKSFLMAGGRMSKWTFTSMVVEALSVVLPLSVSSMELTSREKHTKYRTQQQYSDVLSMIMKIFSCLICSTIIAITFVNIILRS